jgi:hypothetical protein
MTEVVTESGTSWLSREELDAARERLPICTSTPCPCGSTRTAP